MIKNLFLFAAILCFTVVSRAGLTVTISEKGIYGNYIFSATSDSDPISGIEITARNVIDHDADLGFMVVDTLFINEAAALGMVDIPVESDTHLLFSSEDVSVYTEDRDDSTLNIAAGIKNPVMSLDFLNIVLAPGTSRVTVYFATGSGDDKMLVPASYITVIDYSGDWNITSSFNEAVIPEPASISLLALAGLVAICRK